ncbi:MAG: hypothetical protein HRT45_06205 [Bdellovibrionales bacterium]|nr:hypothetical protein [Bdellovibrionales bacterium]
MNDEIGVEYHLPSGEIVEPGREGEHKYIKAQYFSYTSDTRIPGGGLLAPYDMIFLRQRQNVVNWSVSDLENGFISRSICLVVSVSPYKFLSLNLSIDDLPAKLLIARSSGLSDVAPFVAQAESELGLRASSLMVPDKSVSRGGSADRLGHCILNFTGDAESYEFRDLASSSGSLFADATAEDENSLQLLTGQEETFRSSSVSPFETERNWQNLGDEPISLKYPSFVRAGNFKIMVSKTT